MSVCNVGFAMSSHSVDYVRSRDATGQKSRLEDGWCDSDPGLEAKQPPDSQRDRSRPHTGLSFNATS